MNPILIPAWIIGLPLALAVIDLVVTPKPDGRRS